MSKKNGVYGIFNLVNKKVYIGSSGNKRGLNARLTRHKIELNQNTHHNSHLQRAWNKYGSINFEFRILEECEIDMLIIKEQEWMNFYKSNNPEHGYNLIGADRHVMSDETKEKIRSKMIGRTFSQESKKKMSSSAMGNCKFLGKHHSDKAKEKIRKAQLGKIIDEETKEKLRIANTGRKHTEEAKKKMSIASSGRIRSPEHCKKLSEAKKRYWMEKKHVSC